MKQKTFIFSAQELGGWDETKGRVAWDPIKANTVIDDFIKDKEIVSISVATLCRGNNPPNYGLVYVIVYNEYSKKGENK